MVSEKENTAQSYSIEPERMLKSNTIRPNMIAD